MLALFVAVSAYAQDDPDAPTDDLGNVTDAFQTHFFEALKQKGIENYELALNALAKAEKAAKGDPTQLAVVQYEMGKNQIELKRFQEAEDNLKQVLSVTGEQMDVMETLYDLYYQQKNYEAAIPLVQRLIPLDEDYKEDLANLLHRTKRFDEALTLLDELDETWGETAYRNALRRQIYRITGDKEGAISNLENKIDKNPKNEQDYLNLIYLYSEQGDTQKAFQTAEELLSQQPNSQLVHLALYKFYLDADRVDEAQASMKIVFNSTQIGQDNKYKVLNDFLNYLRSHPEQETMLEDVVASFSGSNNGRVYQQLGDYYVAKDQKSAALPFYEKGVSLDPDNFSLLKNTLLLQIDVRKYDQAYQLSGSGLEIFPAQPLLYLLNGVAANGMERPDDAIESLEAGIDFLLDDPKMEKDFYQQLSISYQLKGNQKKADQYAAKASQINSPN